MRVRALWATAVVAILLATPQVANTQAPANPAESAPPSYAAPQEPACESVAPRLLGPIVDARPIADAELEESSLPRSEAGPSVAPLGVDTSTSDHLFGGQWNPEAMPVNDRDLNFDNVLPAEPVGISDGETNFVLDVATERDFFLHAGTACGAMAGEIRFQGDY